MEQGPRSLHVWNNDDEDDGPMCTTTFTTCNVMYRTIMTNVTNGHERDVNDCNTQRRHVKRVRDIMASRALWNDNERRVCTRLEFHICTLFIIIYVVNFIHHRLLCTTQLTQRLGHDKRRRRSSLTGGH